MWVRCTAFSQMVKGLPDIGDTTIREEGTAFHWAALMVWLGHTVPVGTIAPNKVAIDDDMIDGIDAYIDRIKTWGGTPRLEFQVAAPRIHPACGGTCDAWSFDPVKRILHVGDAKYGFRFVNPFECWQLLVYVSGLLDYLGVEDDSTVMVEMCIFQPRAYRQGGPWHTWTVRASDLRAYFNTLRNAAEMVLSPRATCQTGAWCNSCNGRLNCDAFDAAFENALEVAGEPINNDTNPSSTNNQLLRVERALDILEARQSALNVRAEMFMRQGKQLQHYDLQAGQSRLHWKEGMSDALRGLATVRKVELFTQKPITPTQAKKVLDPAIVDALSERYAGKLKVVRVAQDRASRIFGAIGNGN